MVTLNAASALVLGASGGLGRPISERLSERGAAVTMVAQNPQRLQQINVTNGTCLARDLRDPGAIDDAVATAAIQTDNPGIDVVVNAAGVVAFGEIDELDSDIVEELFMVNTFTAIHLARTALPHLNPGAMVVNLAGVIAEQNLPGMSAYGASKAAVAAFDTAFAREARRRKVQVVTAFPPHTETGLADRAIAGQAPTMPTGADPNHVANVIVDGIENNTRNLSSAVF